MKKIILSLAIVCIMLISVFPANASTVTYSGNSGEFIFAPGSEYSPTDLFTEFKSVMPGDSITQQINVTNKASNKVKVKIYMRSLGSKDDFLSRLKLKVAHSENNDTAYMFDAAANETAGLTDWVCLGTLYSGGSVNLDVTLDVPIELDNSAMDKIGVIDWEFKVEEFEIEEDDPKTPNTSDNSLVTQWTVMLAIFTLAVILLITLKSKINNKNSTL